ncbi:hypothetical protein DLAC_10817 [Tieghemostelium lacteum]|uniref:Uncharacterized protein n=1 Tax=Tieghemostelium lacteum TaxID=361077 RepID=A0A151Z3V2_TIELA|nr:hypothetical protein DLAC_10817 [Tieghemostelium lacteum]|eukprot:KYQ88642.1 hypothetical protein DLAC_10817 [Tieghemostelium lacteum]
MVDIDTLFENLCKKLKTINDKQLIDLKVKFTNNVQSFETLQTLYNSEKLKIDNMFKDLVDYIHIKQVSIQRELKSHFDDLEEKHTLQQTMIESNLKIISIIEHIAQGISKQEIQATSLLQLIENVNKSEVKFEIMEYGPMKYKLDDNGFELVKERIELLELTTTSSNNLYMYSIRSQSQIMEIYNLTKKTIKEIPISKFELNGQLFTLQCSATSEKYLYILTSSGLITIDIRNSNYKLELKPINIPIKYEIPQSYSTIYDGKNSIYLFGGVDHDSIYRLDLTSYDIHKLDAKLPEPSIWYSMSIDTDTYDDIYLVGGVTKLGGLFQILKFNITTQNIQTILIPGMAPYSENYHDIFGVYVGASEKSLFIRYTKNNNFFSFNPILNIKTPLPSPPTHIGGESGSRMYYNPPNHSIYLLDNGDTTIYSYNIHKKTWSKEMDLSLSLKASQNISFSNFA